ncbi:tyrosine decarboxylase [Ligilactobacillus ceti]|uniref:Tyrosine decarboxylase n=1 Tax=Ligilactobacillus ceti DSM 22408 TaxID=1122146 RepID=A0A0R2KIG9_9LACO|nr:tyrosine decarboxylase [Ligilactobacillus ceti]KRN89128.1 tyrosine decarboxylase [Ligilactobacillus ceti DSM 22408]
MKENLKDLNLDALFIGDKSENGDIYKRLTNKLIDEHLGWRQNYMPQDQPIMKADEKNEESFKTTVAHMEDVLSDLSVRLRTNSVPWHSPRFWGHMNTETLMPALLAYNYAMLWNGNNVAYESSPGTSIMEEEVGEDFAQLFSYKEGWGHIVADGSIANLEGLWYARNMKSIPLALKEVVPETVAGKSEWELLNMSVDEIMNILDGLDGEVVDAVKAKSARSGENLHKLGKWLIPQTKHYSWMKAADIIGIGLDQVIPVPVDSHYQMDMAELEKIVRNLAAENTPVLGVVGVVGSTEEGAVDPIHKIVALREKLLAEGIFYYIHVDAAYGGYARSLFLDENFDFIPYNELKDVHQEHGVYQEDVEYITEEVHAAFDAISKTESVTIDPHKMGYIPYSAGGIAIRDKKMRNIISYFATYVFDKDSVAPSLLGAYILEGSKAGATAAGVWTAHRVLPLNVTGYGKLEGRSVEASRRFYEFLQGLEFDVNGTTIEVNPLTEPDFNMVDWTFNVKGNKDLVKMNELNKVFYDYASANKGGSYDNEFITSHTDFAIPEYGDSPLEYVKSMGFTEEEWRRADKVTILRACVLTPFMYDKDNFAEYAGKIKEAIQAKLEKSLSEVKF